MAGAKTAANGSPNPFLTSVEWMKPLSEAPAKFYGNLCRQSLGAVARGLQAQTDYVRKLAECEGPAEAFACQSEFVARSIAGSVEESRRLFAALQGSFAAAGPGK